MAPAGNSDPGRAAPVHRRTRRQLSHLEDLPRDPAASAFRAGLERAGKDPAPNRPLLDWFSNMALSQWIETFLAHILDKSCKLPSYAEVPSQSLYTVPDGFLVALAGDWGTGTEESAIVARRMEAHSVDLTIHLGDVYYVGDIPSIRENCLNIPNPANFYQPVEWPIGKLGSFALMGNHEMYATGQPYLDEFLPELGIKVNGKPQGQGTSYFSLENPWWRIIALDTGYHSRGLPGTDWLAKKLPFLSFLAPSCRIPDVELAWFDDVLRLKDDQTHGIILLSHHQYYTFSSEPNYTRAAGQLATYIRRPVLWFWGHEHCLEGYELSGPSGLQAYGRCLGHGGMPVDRWPVPAEDQRGSLLFFDRRPYKASFGMNGYATLRFDRDHLTVRYHDIMSDEPLIEEHWVTSKGQVRLAEIKQKCKASDFYGPEKWG
jgi:hypothetical protein